VRREGQKGQAIIELALLFPILLLVFMGAWTGAALIANNDTAAQVSGYGARIAAEIGNGCSLVSGTLTCPTASGCQQTTTDPCAVDQAIIAAMTPALTSQLSNSQVTEIDIYQPADCTANSNNWTSNACPVSAGQWVLADTLVDKYKYCSTGTAPTFTPQWVLINRASGTTSSCASLGGSQVGGVAHYTLDQRSQTVANEQAIGVSLTFQFTSPGLKFFSQTDTVYTAITFPPQGS
jgi:hypothetical protein